MRARRGRARHRAGRPSASSSPTARSTSSRPHPTVGYVKSHRVTYLEPDRNAVVAALAPGQRTPLFCIADYARYSWYVRLAMLAGGHSWTGVVRCEASGHLPLADGSSRSPTARRRILPLVASEPHVDPRAPQNLVPIGALERELRHRMGDRGLVFRRAARRPSRSRVPGGVVTDEREQVGRVLGSEHSSTSAFRVVLDDDDFLQLDDLVVVRTQVPEGRRGAHLRRRHRGRGGLRGRELRVRHPPHRRARHHAGREGAQRAGAGHAGRPRGVGLPRPRRDGRARDRRGTREGALRRRDGAAARGRASGATSCPCTSTSTSSTAARAATCRSAASRGVATKTSFALFFLRMLSRASSTPASSARARRTCGCWSST